MIDILLSLIHVAFLYATIRALLPFGFILLLALGQARGVVSEKEANDLIRRLVAPQFVKWGRLFLLILCIEVAVLII